MQPQILVLDEPTAGLDPRSRKDLLDRIQWLKQTEKMTVIFVSHNMEEVAYLSDRIYVLAGGKSVAHGTPREIFGNREILFKHRIGTPETVEILYRLQELGYPVDVTAFETEAAAAEIVSILQPSGR
ncbi:energy-coupling factor transport system ATP-binding protein [Lihuaxuella thermophila]|uniref:Energy-coupling factor transport system ATP-binding protein n=1 Tax=Lihuaxuella thermophila TaxID=1173111 RepID=A0A1H8EJI6_9BACL|nr:energy-coupling factor transport system ATP-binding protein [Lihuaxuella thermophila]